MKIALLSLVLFQVPISHAQTVTDNLNWVSTSSVQSATSPSFTFCNGQVSYTIASTIGFYNVSNAGNPNYLTGIVTPAYIFDPSPTIPMSITFSQPVCNLRIRICDLDGGQNEYLSAISTPYNGLTDVVGHYFGTGSVLNSSIDDAKGWVEWDGPITNLSFNYNRPGPGCGLIIDSILFDCCIPPCQAPNPGTNNTWSICSNGASADLFPLLGPGASTSNGTWTNPSGAIVAMPYDPLTMNPGIYTYTVDSNGCSSSATITVTEINPTVSVVPTDATCHGMANGSAVLTVTNATIYTLDGGPNTPIPSPFVINNLAAGTYEVVVYHVSGCTDTENFTINEPLIAQPVITSISPDLVLCSAGVSTLTATGSGGTMPYTFTWLTNNGILGTGSTINVTTSQTTQYGVILTEACGAISDTTFMTIVVAQPPNPGTNNTWSICSNGASADLFPLLGPGASTSNGTWTNPSGAIVAMPYDPLTMNPGIYTYTVDSNGCSSSATITVTEINPTVSVVPTDATCHGMANGSAVLTVTNATIYTLDGGPNTPIPSPFVINNLAAGIYEVVVYHVSGCTDTENFTINEPPIAQPVITSISPDLVLCSAGVSTLTATGSGGTMPYTFTWLTNNGILGTGSTINVTTSQTTQYGVILTEACGAISDTTFMTIVVAQPLIPIITPDDVAGCYPHHVIFSNNTPGPGSPLINTIDFGDGSPVITTNGLDTCSHTYEFPGVYTVSITSVSDTGCTYTNTFQNVITVYDKPVADFNISPNPTTFFETHIQLNNNSSADVVSYNWSIPGAEPNQSSYEDPAVDLPEGIIADYNVTLVVTNENGCIDSITKIAVVNSDVILYAPNAFTPDGDEFNQTWFLYMDGIDIQQFHLQVFNRWGEVVWESNDPNARWDGTYHGKIVPNGLYNWILEAKELMNDKKYTFNGYINVMR